MSPAETLRAAATLIRETASNATPGPWAAALDVRHNHGVLRARSGSDLEWIALMSPQVAEPLAAWLEHVAEVFVFVKRSEREHALAVAAAILGRQS